MAEPAFKVGDLVRVRLVKGKALLPHIFEVVDYPLVTDDGQPVYVVRGGGRERVVREDQLAPASKPQP